VISPSDNGWSLEEIDLDAPLPLNGRIRRVLLGQMTGGDDPTPDASGTVTVSRRSPVSTAGRAFKGRSSRRRRGDSFAIPVDSANQIENMRD